MAVLQVRIDDDLKFQSNEVLDKLGIDLSTAIRMFLKRVVIEGGIPFDSRIDETTLNGLMALRKMQLVSERNGNSEMTVDEINEEIRLAREENKNRHK